MTGKRLLHLKLANHGAEPVAKCGRAANATDGERTARRGTRWATQPTATILRPSREPARANGIPAAISPPVGARLRAVLFPGWVGTTFQ